MPLMTVSVFRSSIRRLDAACTLKKLNLFNFRLGSHKIRVLALSTLLKAWHEARSHTKQAHNEKFKNTHQNQ